MNAQPDSDALAQLRHRFLLEPHEQLTEWLWEEHPQTAAFLLNWLGDPALLHAYLQPLPMLQQADILFRIAALSNEWSLSELQHQLLLTALRRISRPVRKADASMLEADAPPVRAERLYWAYLSGLDDETRAELVGHMEEVAPVLARVGAMGVPEAEAERQEAGVHALLNTFADLLTHALGRRFPVRTLVYPDTVEMVAAAGAAEYAPRQVATFRLAHEDSESSMFLLVSHSFLFHYLEASLGAPRSRVFQLPAKAELSPLETELGRAMAQELAEDFTLALGGEVQQSAGYRASVLPEEEAVLELGSFGRTPFLSCRLTVQAGQSLAGTIGLLIPPSHLRALRSLAHGHLLDDMLPDAAGAANPQAPPGGPDAVRRLLTRSGIESDGGSGGGNARGNEANPDAAAEAEEDAAVSLEEFLWRIELEEAEKAGTRPPPPEPQPIDLLLQGYDPRDIASQGEDSHEAKARMAELHYDYGARFFQIGHYEEAIEALEDALDCDAEHARAQLLLAAAWGERGMYFKEILAYRKLIAREQAVPEAHVLLARRLSFLGRAEDAYDALEGAMALEFEPREIVETDPAFKAVRGTPRWRQYLADRA